MNDWTDYLYKSEALKAIYRSDPPNLDLVDLHDLSIKSVGPEVVMRIDLYQYPDVPPKKWLDQDFNQVQLTLSAVNADDVRLRWDGQATLCAMRVSKYKGMVQVEMKSESIDLSLKAELLRLVKISAYQNSEEGLAWRL